MLMRYPLTLAALLTTVAVSPAAAQHTDPAYAPLWLYNGTWIATSTQSSKADTLANDCSRLGKYFACQQTVNGAMSGLIIFLPRAERGKYFTQGVSADGHALGRGELTIDGVHWTYSSVDQSKDTTVYYRTTNTFTGTEQIHFELSESRNGSTWTVTRKGDEHKQ